jgi:DNA helicase HerA-like ATPase
MAAMVTTRSQLPSLSFAACPGRVPIDLDGLVATRLLIQANSGAGKSWAVRWLLERTHGRIQQFVLDWEGEFASLRERFAYVPAGQDGDVPADPRTAGLLCRRLLELGASAVLDLSERQPEDRRRFAQGFLHELMHVLRSLWRPLLVAMEEAHHLAPEKGEGEAVSKPAVALCTQGRKRGYSAVLATQRIAKVTNNALAELLNVLIGPTSFEPDVRRAGDALGFDKAQREQLKRLEPGQFFARGPALAREPVLVRTGPVQTTHPQPGRVAPPVPPPPEAIRALLGQLRDLPTRAAADLDDLEQAAAASPSSSARCASGPWSCARRPSSNVSRWPPSTRGRCNA